ncbi:hypothetical protein V8C34DRAFT_176057 [Trichoderma compactum]
MQPIYPLPDVFDHTPPSFPCFFLLLTISIPFSSLLHNPIIPSSHHPRPCPQPLCLLLLLCLLSSLSSLSSLYPSLSAILARVVHLSCSLSITNGKKA